MTIISSEQQNSELAALLKVRLADRLKVSNDRISQFASIELLLR